MAHGNYWLDKRLHRRQVLRSAGAGAMGVAAAGLLSCGDDSDSTSPGGTPTSPGGTPTPTLAPPTPSATQPKRGGTITIQTHSAEVAHLDPDLQTVQAYHGFGPGLIYNRLLRQEPLDLYNQVQTIVADIAQSWEQPSDLEYIFKLHSGVKFHNIAPVNGREVTAEDVVWSFQRQIAQKLNAQALGNIDRMTVVDATTLRITVRAPSVDQFVQFSADNNKIKAKEQLAVAADLKEMPAIGTGAWMLDRWVKDDPPRRYLRNPDYFEKAPDGKPYPYADVFEDYVIPDPAAILANLRSKKTLALIVGAPNKKALEDIKAGDSNFVVDARPSIGSMLSLWTNTQRKPMDDPRVRQAILKAIDRPGMNEVLYVGEANINVGPKVPDPAALLPQAEMDQLLRRDVAGARQLLEAAGVKDLTVRLTASPGAQAELIMANLAEVGIKANFQRLDTQGGGLDAILRERNYDLAYTATPPGHTTSGDLAARWRSDGARNPTGLSDAELDRLIDAQALELDRARRFDLLKQIQRHIVESAAVIPLIGTVQSQGNWPELQGLITNYWPDYFEPFAFSQMWLDR